MIFKIEGKEMLHIFVFAKFCWSAHSEVVRFVKHLHSKQRRHSHTTSAVLRQVYVHALLVQHLEQCSSTGVPRNPRVLQNT